MQIREVKLIKKGEALALVVIENGACPQEATIFGKNRVHPDLIKAIQGLRVHLAILSEYLPEKDAHKNADELEKFFVTGYSLGGEDAGAGVTIKGWRSRKRAGVTTLNPFVLFDEAPETRYALIGDVETKIKAIEKEVVKYMQEGKRADPELFGAPGEGEGTPANTKPPKGEKSGKVTKLVIAPGAEPSVFPNIPKADPDAMERVRNDGADQGGQKSAAG